MAVGALTLAGYLVVKTVGDAAPNSTFGKAVGIAAAVTLLVVMLYSARRSRPAVRTLGPTRRYLEMHVWGGTLFFVLLLVHTDLGLPRSLLGWTLWGCGMWIVLTGAIGSFLQWMLPKILASAASFDVNLQRAPELVDQLRLRADALVKTAEPRIQAFHQQQIAPELSGIRRDVLMLLRNPGGTSGRGGAIDILRKTLTPEGVITLEALGEIRTAKHQIDMHVNVQRILRAWLFAHLPVAIAMIVVVVVHVFFVVYY